MASFDSVAFSTDSFDFNSFQLLDSSGSFSSDAFDTEAFDVNAFDISIALTPTGLHTLNDWLAFEGYYGQVNDAFMAFMVAQGITEGQWNDRLFTYLSGLGYTGSLSDMFRDWNFGQ